MGIVFAFYRLENWKKWSVKWNQEGVFDSLNTTFLGMHCHWPEFKIYTSSCGKKHPITYLHRPRWSAFGRHPWRARPEGPSVQQSSAFPPSLCVSSPLVAGLLPLDKLMSEHRINTREKSCLFLSKSMLVLTFLVPPSMTWVVTCLICCCTTLLLFLFLSPKVLSSTTFFFSFSRVLLEGPFCLFLGGMLVS